jgi:hypothetical protein
MMNNPSKITQIRYEQILNRSFKSDVERFLFESIFLEQLEKETLKEEYERFVGSAELEEKYLSARQLAKDDEVIDYKGLQLTVRRVDEFYKEWLKDKSRLNEYKNLFKKHRFITFEDFVSFYEKVGQDKACEYCGITESQIEALIAKGRIHTKRLLIRGRSLEVDKKNPNGKYENGNMTLCCYWCNNAKSDEFSYDEFRPVGNAIKEIWKKRF